MTIHLPEDLESTVRSLVQGGRFESEDALIAEAVRSFLGATGPTPSSAGPGSIGAMREDAELLDRAVAHAMKVREERPWRMPTDE